jgi:hypothetical protein
MRIEMTRIVRGFADGQSLDPESRLSLGAIRSELRDLAAKRFADGLTTRQQQRYAALATLELIMLAPELTAAQQ